MRSFRCTSGCRRDGRSDAGFGAGAFGDDGCGRCVFGRAFLPGLYAEVLLVIAYVGASLCFLPPRSPSRPRTSNACLAYSTVSQLGYMMLGLGVGGWAAGMFHLITHAFFKSLLFMCSGSVIHATHTNEMPPDGRACGTKMPWTAYTMLVGVPGDYRDRRSRSDRLQRLLLEDAIIAQALSFWNIIQRMVRCFFTAAAGGAAITAFYMFRLWYHDVCRRAARSSHL